MRHLVWLLGLIAVPCAVGHAQARAQGAVVPARHTASEPHRILCRSDDALPTPVVPGIVRCASDRAGTALAWQSAAPRPSSLWSIPASAVLPGAGQVMLGVSRFIPYVVVEAYGWWQYSASRRDFRRHRSAYRSLAASVARAPFSTDPPTGDFAYYEHMSYWLESGVLDRVPGGAVEPELDTTTYNGAMWLLARRTYWPDSEQPPNADTPEFQRAMDFYLRRAYAPSYQWSWRGAETEQDRFRRLIGDSNDANRRAIQHVGLLVANHLLSTIDAYVTVRLRRQTLTAGMTRWELVGSLPFGPP